MTPQFIRTEGGEESVVLTRHAYDTLLARLGDEAAEDQAVTRMADGDLAEAAAGRGASTPHWFAVSIAEHGSAVRAARKPARASRKDMARILGVSQGDLTIIARGQVELSDGLPQALAQHAQIDAAWLV